MASNIVPDSNGGWGARVIKEDDDEVESTSPVATDMQEDDSFTDAAVESATSTEAWSGNVVLKMLDDGYTPFDIGARARIQRVPKPDLCKAFFGTAQRTELRDALNGYESVDIDAIDAADIAVLPRMPDSRDAVIDDHGLADARADCEEAPVDPELKAAYAVLEDLMKAIQRTHGDLYAAGAFSRSAIAALAKAHSCDKKSAELFDHRARKFGADTLDLVSLRSAVERRLHGRDLRLIPAAEILTREDPRFLIDKLVEERGLCELFGASKVGKSFVMLAWAFSIAMGCPWLGYETLAGPVVYVVAEGAGGMRKRLRALMTHYGLDVAPADLYFIDQAVDLIDPQSIREAIAAVEELDVHPVLVVFDTYARCMSGDENSAKDTGVAIAALDTLRFTPGTTVCVVHHTGKTGNDQRGSSAFFGAADSVLRLDSAAGRQLTLTNTKQKNFEEAAPVLFQLTPVGDSLVPVPRTAAPSDGVSDDGRAAGKRRANDDERIAAEIIAALREAMKGDGAMYRTQTELLKAVKGNAQRKATVLHALVEDETSPVQREKVGNKGYRYFIR